MNAQTSIVASLVPNGQRLASLPNLFGARCVHAEAAIFDQASELIDGYSGAYWEFFSLSNGGFYMAPCLPGVRPRVQVDGNGFNDTMSADAAGIVCCLMAFSQESCEASGLYQERLAEQYHLLRDFAADHPEAAAIFAAID